MTTLTPSPHATRRTFLTLAGALLARGQVQAAEFREISWDDLVPAGWDPMTSLKGMGNYPDTDPRAQELYNRMRKLWDAAPTVASMAGQSVRLPGYLVPLDATKDGLREFLLVPYAGACIHTPPPPANQIVHVRTQAPIKGFRTMDAVWVSGTIGLERSKTDMGSSGYTMIAKQVVIYMGKER